MFSLGVAGIAAVVCGCKYACEKETCHDSFIDLDWHGRTLAGACTTKQQACNTANRFFYDLVSETSHAENIQTYSTLILNPMHVCKWKNVQAH